MPHSKGKYAHNSRVICDILDITTLATNLVPHSKEKYDEIDYYFVWKYVHTKNLFVFLT